MKKSFACFLVFVSLYSNPLFAQNLVLNPSFEKRKDLTLKRRLEMPIHAAKYWLNPTAGQPKIYASNQLGFIYDKEGTSWNFRAKSGKRVAALFVYGHHPLTGALRRDYIQGQLMQPLEVGKKYYFSFWVHYHCEGSDKIGIAFLPEWTYLLRPGLLELKPDAYQKEVSYYSRDDSWAIVKDSFIARRAYETFIIGNFFSNEDTKVESDNIGHHLAYIDDISVEEATNQDMPGKNVPAPKIPIQPTVFAKTPSKKPEPTPQKSLPPDPSPALPKAPPARNYPVYRTYTFPTKKFEVKPIFFAYDSPLIQKKYKGEIMRLLTYLEENPKSKILIKGYASEEGSTMYNFLLAMERAEQAMRFLRSRGIGPDRMAIKVLGEDASPEDLARGKPYNRRVDFELTN